MTSAYVLIAAVLLLGGLLAALGDRLGTKVGKARLRLFNLRPKQTAILLTIVTGVSISASTLGILFATSESLRKGVFQLDDILKKRRRVQRELDEVEVELARVKEQKDRVENELVTARNQQAEAQQRLDEINLKFQEAQTLLQQFSAQADELRQEINALLASKQELLAQKNELQQQIAQLQAEVEERDRKLAQGLEIITKQQQRIKTQEQQVTTQQQKLTEQENRLAQIQRQRKTLITEINKRDNQIDTLDRAIAQQNQALEEREKRLEKLEVELEKQQSQLQKEIERRDEAIAVLDAAIANRDQILQARSSRLLDLETQLASLQQELVGLEEYYENYQALREGNLALVRGQVLSYGTITNVNLDTARTALEKLLRQANNTAIRATNLPGNDQRVITIAPLQVEQAISKIKDGQNYVVQIVSAGNYLEGETEVRVFADVVINEKIFDAGSEIATVPIDTKTMTKEEVQQRVDLLLATSSFRARGAGILGDIQVADGSVSELITFIEQVNKSEEPLDELKAIASEPTYASGPLKMRLVALQNGEIVFQT
ncbi:MAG: DUF3084 domain-containing protein [Oscillatoria sp. PMC 1068.18]|nr:DUF3084 domain-containing protein [Oscillatoria sp. PMC 1076.18]MEC4989849.1 DUF3084 domain-containing protein [Oscillatoria sp. PMC 1068.18]